MAFATPHQVKKTPNMMHYVSQEAVQEDTVAEEPLDSYVVVNKEDVLEAMGCFVASYLAQLPQAQNLQPAELQKAIKHAFKVQIGASRGRPDLLLHMSYTILLGMAATYQFSHPLNFKNQRRIPSLTCYWRRRASHRE